MSWFITNLITIFIITATEFICTIGSGYCTIIAPAIQNRCDAYWWVHWPCVVMCHALCIRERVTMAGRSRHTAVWSAAWCPSYCDTGGRQLFSRARICQSGHCGDTHTLLRLRYGVKLYCETHRPILVTGVKPMANGVSESQQIWDILEQDFRVPVSWTEDSSDNTFAILQKAVISKIYLITQTWHRNAPPKPFAAQDFRLSQLRLFLLPAIRLICWLFYRRRQDWAAVLFLSMKRLALSGIKSSRSS